MSVGSPLQRFFGLIFVAALLQLAGCASASESTTESSAPDGIGTLHFDRDADRIIAQEQAQGAEQIEVPWTDHSMVSFSTGQQIKGAIVLARQNTSFKPKPYVTYYFTKQDSVLWQAKYMWEASRNGQYLLERGVCDHRPEREVFESVYDDLRERLISRFGEPTQTESMHRDTLAAGHFKWERDDEWKSDSLEVNLRLDYGSGFREVEASLTWKEPLQGGSSR